MSKLWSITAIILAVLGMTGMIIGVLAVGARELSLFGRIFSRIPGTMFVFGIAIALVVSGVSLRREFRKPRRERQTLQIVLILAFLGLIVCALLALLEYAVHAVSEGGKAFAPLGPLGTAFAVLMVLLFMQAPIVVVAVVIAQLGRDLRRFRGRRAGGTTVRD